MNLLHGIGVAVLGSLLMGCGGDDDGGDSSDDESESSGQLSGSGNSGGGSGSGSSGGGSTNYTAEELAAGACDEEDSAQSSECEAYSECVQQECKSEYEMCLGANYLSGDFSGAVCEEFFDCSISAENQCDNDCAVNQACQNCLVSNVGGCATSKCSAEYSECSGGAMTDVDLGGLGSATCADLEACCASLSGDEASTCEMQLDQIRVAGDSGCSGVFTIYQISGTCQ